MPSHHVLMLLFISRYCWLNEKSTAVVHCKNEIIFQSIAFLVYNWTFILSHQYWRHRRYIYYVSPNSWFLVPVIVHTHSRGLLSATGSIHSVTVSQSVTQSLLITTRLQPIYSSSHPATGFTCIDWHTLDSDPFIHHPSIYPSMYPSMHAPIHLSS